MKEMLTTEQQAKLEKLREYIRGLGSLAVGFSGGADSALLLYVAHEVLGDKVIAVTGADASVPEREVKEAKVFCEERGIRHIICTTDPLKNERYRKNDPDRCYFCKYGIFTEIKKIADENGIAFLAEGSNMDDIGDYRPGLRAVEELSVKSPLREAGLTKADIRMISKTLGLPTWSKPAYACLASRFVYGEEITEEKLHMIDRAEQFLIENGFLEERVRMHGNIARIEVPAKDIPRLAGDEMRTAVYEHFKKLGFMFVTLDMLGYRMGSMNKTLKKMPDQIDLRWTDGKDKAFREFYLKTEEYYTKIVGGLENRRGFVPYNQSELIPDVLIVYSGEKAIGCGGLKRYSDEDAEIKRVWVEPEWRRHHLATKIMNCIEEKARGSGYKRLILQTRQIMTEAVGLYTKLGYEQTENYPPYDKLDGAVCFAKSLDR